MAIIELSPNNSAFVQITITNSITGTSIDNATVNGKIENPDGSVLVASFSMDYVASSSGIYRATLTPIAGLIAGVIYKVVIDSNGVDSLAGHWSQDVKATELQGS